MCDCVHASLILQHPANILPNQFQSGTLPQGLASWLKMFWWYIPIFLVKLLFPMFQLHPHLTWISHDKSLFLMSSDLPHTKRHHSPHSHCEPWHRSRYIAAKRGSSKPVSSLLQTTRILAHSRGCSQQPSYVWMAKWEIDKSKMAII